MYEIKYQDETYQIDGITYLVLRRLAKLWQLKTVNEVEETIQKISEAVTAGHFDALDKFGELIREMIRVKYPEFNPEPDEVINQLMIDDEFANQINYIIPDSVNRKLKKNNPHPKKQKKQSRKK